MTQKMTNPRKCVVLRGGFEVWVDANKAEKLQSTLENLTAHFFVRWEGQSFNTADIVGVFTAEITEERTRRRNGQWQCQQSKWHDRGEKCFCLPENKNEWTQKILSAIKSCGKCNDGWVSSARGMRRCECCARYFAPDGISFSSGG